MRTYTGRRERPSRKVHLTITLASRVSQETCGDASATTEIARPWRTYRRAGNPIPSASMSSVSSRTTASRPGSSVMVGRDLTTCRPAAPFPSSRRIPSIRHPRCMLLPSHRGRQCPQWSHHRHSSDLPPRGQAENRLPATVGKSIPTEFTRIGTSVAVSQQGWSVMPEPSPTTSLRTGHRRKDAAKRGASKNRTYDLSIIRVIRAYLLLPSWSRPVPTCPGYDVGEPSN
jgi:hypothetical protein